MSNQPIISADGMRAPEAPTQDLDALKKGAATCTADNFVQLHVHTTYSVLDGISRREDIIARAKAYNMGAVAITEHGNIHNAISWFKACKEANVKPIIGMEAYVAPDTRFGRVYAKKGEAEEDAKNGDLSMSAYHLTILAKNRQGYENLKKISSLAYREGFYRKPRIDDELLAANKEGLIVLSGCLASKISRFIIAGNTTKALEEVDKMRGVFGDDFYLEVMNHSIPEESVVLEALKGFSKERGIGLVFTGDSHYTDHGDEFAHEIALAIGTGKNINSPDRWSFNGEGYWFKSPLEMRNGAASVGIPEEACNNTVDIASRVDDYDFKLTSKTKKSIIPLYRIEDRVLTDEQCALMLDMKAYEGLASRKLPITQQYQDRMKEELDLIKSKNFSSYFLIIADIVDFMRKKGMIVPMGRGSAGASLLCYCLYITGLDPIRLNLSFSRFLNKGRKDLPDIDTDISQERRGEVIEYLVNKYGKDRVAQIVTFQTMASKGAADNVGRALGIPSSVRNAIGKLIGDVDADTTLKDILEDDPRVREKMSEHKDWIDVSMKLEGNVRNLGAHAAGIVISNEPLLDYVPLIRDSKEGFLVTQYDMGDLAELGLLKLDMLGLKTMDLVHQTMALIQKRHGVTLDFHNFPIWPGQDPATYATIAGGRFVSVFQYDSSGIRGAARALAPDKFDHLMALNALYRPGPMLPKSGSGGKSMMVNYFDRRHGREPVEVWHPLLEETFRESFGIPMYQEQIMALSKIVGKFTDEEADEYRVAIGKKDAGKFKAVQDKLVERGVANGFSQEFMTETTRKLAGSARYNWNKSHAALYSYISFATAHLETHYPMEYYTTLLNVNLDDNDKLKILLAAIIQKGVKLLPPHINHSGPMFQTDGQSIYMGLLSIRQLGDTALELIISDRTTNGPYKDYLDFHMRISKHGRVNKLVKENLVKSGAFNWDKQYDMRTKIDNCELMQKIIKKFEDKMPPDEIRLEVESMVAPALSDYTEQEKLDLERAVLNFYISSHPVLQYQALFNLFPNINFITPSQMNEQQVGSHAIVLGLIESKIMKTAANGNPYLQLKYGDQMGSFTQMVWSPLAASIYPSLIDGQLAIMSGVIKEDKFWAGGNQLNVNSILPINAISGVPINAFYAEDMPTANRILTMLNTTASSISDKMLNRGHAVLLKDNAYIKPEQVQELNRCGRAHFMLSL